MKVLIIEDEAHIRKLLKDYLRMEGFIVDEAPTGERGLILFSQNVYDLIILDIMVPEVDGWSVCQRIRKTSNVPIIMVTAKSTESDKILGLELGADDYLVKPFSPKELIARIKALFRRIKNFEPNYNHKVTPLRIGDMVIDPQQNTVIFNNNSVILSPKEFAIVHCLARSRNKVFTRNELLLEVWGDQFTELRTVDAHIKAVREKFRRNTIDESVIETVWGVGYKFGGDFQ